MSPLLVLQRYDWMRNEPNDWNSQNCLTFLKDQVRNLSFKKNISMTIFKDIFGYGVYHWNDWDCQATARYICERSPIEA